MPLSFADEGRTLVVLRVGGSPKVRTHLENLGITQGAVSMEMAAKITVQ